MDVLLWGATGQAKVLRECLGHSGHLVVAVADNDPEVTAPWPGVTLLRGWSECEGWLAARRSSPAFCVAVGGGRGGDRLALHERLEQHGLTALTVVHPTAFVAADAQLGPGSQVLAQSAVGTEAVLGRSCIVNTGAVVEHECVLDAGVHVGPGARLAGLVRVGQRVFLGAGAIVLPRVTIGADAVVGAGAVVLEDVAAGAVVVGNPARPLHSP